MDKMTCSTQELVSLYESGSLTIEELASEMNLEVASIKAVLLQYSAKYQTLLKQKQENEDVCLINKDELKLMLEAYKTIALSSDVDAVRERALKNLVNLGLKVTDGLGENDAKKLLQKGNINLTLIQQNILKARESIAKSKQKALAVIENKKSKEVILENATNEITKELEVVNA